MRMGTQSQKNIWVAASDGELERVQYLIEEEGISPNAPDPNTYTPMHAAASYGHINVLEYLVSKGGDVNITDEDGDTPLYTVESMEVAKWLVDNGAIVERVNSEDISPAQHLFDDYPAIAQFLDPTIDHTSQNNGATEAEEEEGERPSEYAQEQLTERLTSQMMQSVAEIMARAAEGGYDPEDELEELVRKTVLESLDAGEELVEGASDVTGDRENGQFKRQRTDKE
ncbi:hypothetical protein FRC15_008436 [Serendipita sp. 397]|nr:hypothetical protein FRC15_008436 [Serendipita sp. 397]